MPLAAPSPVHCAQKRLKAALSIAPAARSRLTTAADMASVWRDRGAIRSGAQANRAFWRFDDPALNAVCTPSANAVFELAASALGDHTATSALAMALLASLTDRAGALVWIGARTATLEHGVVSGRGLAAFGLDPARMMLVSAKDDRAALWATEEAVTSGAVAGVITEVREPDFTATRRLALRATGAPALLVLPHTREGSTAAQARWRVAATASAPHADDPRAPGRPRWRAVLERSRSPAFSGAPQPFLLEWSHDPDRKTPGDALRLRVVPELADAATEARAPSPILRSDRRTG